MSTNLPLVDKIGTIALTDANSPFIIINTMSIKRVSILPTSATAITVEGTASRGTFGSDPISLNEDDSPLTISADEGNVLDTITITAPSGATANIIYSI
jgi:hypothetical protein